MDSQKIGKLIKTLRKEKQLTQMQLAEHMNISDKTISKWERGLGCPDISFFPKLSGVFDVDLEKLFSGRLDVNEVLGGNMKYMQFYICPNCGNLVTALADTAVSCCGKKLRAVQARKAPEDERLKVESIENDYFISSPHEMTRDHYISFAALLTGDSMMVRRLYPEWDMQTRIPAVGHGRLFWYCTKHGLYYQPV